MRINRQCVKCRHLLPCAAEGEVAMIATIEMLKHQEQSRNEYALHFLRSRGDTGRLQAMLAGRLPANEVLRVALHERELRLLGSASRF